MGPFTKEAAPNGVWIVPEGGDPTKDRGFSDVGQPVGDSLPGPVRCPVTTRPKGGDGLVEWPAKDPSVVNVE